MKIAYILAEFPSLSETFILREICALREMGLEIEIFALRPPAAGPVHAEAETMRPHVYYFSPVHAPPGLRCQTHFLFHQPKTYLKIWQAALRRCRLAPRQVAAACHQLALAAEMAYAAKQLRVDHIHANFAFVTADIAQLAATLLNCSYSVSTHAWDIYTQPTPALCRRLTAASFITVCTQAGLEHLQHLLPTAVRPRLHLVRHGLPPAEFTPGTPDGKTILAVARLVPKKGLLDLIAACAIMRHSETDFRCVIVGSGPQRQELETAILENDLGNYVTLTGPLDGEQVKQLCRQATVMTLPSVILPDGDRDGLPNVILEAMAMQVPVVTTTESAAREVVQDGVNGFLISPHDPQSLARRLRILLRDPALQARLGTAAARQVNRQFNLPEVVKPLYQLFQNQQNP